MDVDIRHCATVPALLEAQARRRGDQLLYRFLLTGDPEGAIQEWTFAELDERARRIAGLLQELGAQGERALLVYPPGLEFVEGFMGCLCAGVTAVPTYPPDPTRLDRTLPRLRAIAQDASAKYVLTTSAILAMANAILPAAPQLAALRWIATDALTAEHADAYRPVALTGDSLAFLQYTSGSTGDPRGVMVSHRNVLHNEEAIARAFRHDSSSRGVGWLPLFHDMGLIGNVIQPLYHGFPCTLMSPLAFLQKPLRWLRAVSMYRGTTSGGPNFAYDLCVRKIGPEDRATLDLSSWQVAFNGAEPIRDATLERFAEAFAPAGFRRDAFYPCYGLAESTLIVTGAEARRDPVVRAFDASGLREGRATAATNAADARPLVSSGHACFEQRIVVVDVATGAPVLAGQIGELWLASDSVAAGYWGREDETVRAFGARLPNGDGPFLRSGDLGFVLDGEVYITGRLKDVIIIRGRNHFPQDLELTVEAAHPAVRPGCAAAFVLEAGADASTEALGIAVEIDPKRAGNDLEAVGRAIQRAIADAHGLAVRSLALLAPGMIAKTSSGKIQRRATRAALASNAMPVLARLEDAPTAVEAVASEPTIEDAALRLAVDHAPSNERVALLLEVLRRELARELRQPIERVSGDAAPAELGLDSLRMLEIEGRLEAVLGRPLPSALLWQHPTLAHAAQALAQAWGAPAVAPVAALEGADDGVVSSGQARLWFLDKLFPDAAVYNVFSGLRLTGPLDVAALERSASELVARHAVLRSVFVAGDDGMPRAVIAPAASVALRIIDLDAIEGTGRARPEVRDVALDAIVRSERAQPFDLTTGPLFRAVLVRLADDDHALLMTMHHAVTDGWSMGVLTRELAALYTAARRNEAAALPPAPSYAALARAQRARASSLTAQRTFWKHKLAGLPRLELPMARTRAGAPSSHGATLRFSLSSAVLDRARELARQRGTTLFTAMLAAFAALLQRYTGQGDFGIGTVVANRARPEHRSVVGFLANTLVLRIDGRGSAPAGSAAEGRRGSNDAGREPSFFELLDRCRATVSEALAHAELPFDDVVRVARPASDTDHNPLFQAAFLMESLPPLALDVPDMTWAPLLDVPDGSVEDTAKFDLALMMSEPVAGEGAQLACQYATDRFDASSIQRLVDHFEVLLGALCNAPAQAIGTLPLLTDAERQRMLVDWNATALAFPATTIHALFEAQAVRTPDAPAVTFGDEVVRYAELDRRAGALAARLVAAGVEPGARVGLYVERSAELVVGLLGILKAGAAYVPLDPAYPADRIAFVLGDAAVAAVVTHDHLAVDLGALACPILDIEAPASEVRTIDVDPEALAYVMYTSGSTGRPKGVMIPHRSVVNFFAAMDERVGAAPGVFLALTSVAFDISVLELLWTLTRGFHVVVHPEQRTTAMRATGRAPELSLFYFADDADVDNPALPLGSAASPGNAGLVEGDRYRLLLEGAKFADRNGFHAVWTPERHFHAFGGLYPNPSVIGAALAIATERVAIRAGSVVLPLHHPVRVAEEWSVVDNLSRGRVGVSFASGWHANDFALATERYADRRTHMAEGMDLVRRLWRGERAQLANGEGAPIEVALRPRPVQPELPVWLTAAGNPETFRTAGELGANILTHLLGQRLDELRDKIAIYRDARARAGHGPGHVTLMLHAFVHRDMETVRAHASEPFRRYLKSSADLMRGFGKSIGVDVDTAAFSDADLDALAARAHDRFFETSGLFGTPRSCADMVHKLEDLGVDEIACLVDFGIATDAVLDSLPYLDALRRRVQRARPAAMTVPAQIAAHGVTHLQCTPSLAQAMLLDPDAERALGQLRTMLVGGEALPAPLAAKLRACGPGQLINMYGPTETTIWSATHVVAADEPGAVVAIGRPIGNTSLYILDAQREPVPVGATGELYIGGAGLAHGYHGRPDLTAERFVEIRGERVYRTGDLARFRDDGAIDFLGRVDHQIKLRGFRIELGEIEATIAQHPAVREVAVAVREERAGDQRLVAYVVAHNGARIDGEALRSLARARLPEYMVPHTVVALAALPQTPNGKLDRKALPALGVEAVRATPFTAARNDLERSIAEIWASVLGVPEVGVHDNFFDLGGHSLLLAQVHAKVRASLRADLSLVKLIEHPTVGALARYLSEAPATGAAATQVAQDRARQQMDALRRQQARRVKR